MNISRHAQERYAERIMDKDDVQDMNLFISNHIQKITEDINKMIEYGELLYEGRSIKKEWHNSIVRIYMRDNWIVVVDRDKQNVITLFTVDLGVGQEMNDLYISKIKEQLSNAKVVFSEKCNEIDKQKEVYESLIAENTDMITEYNRVVNSLVEQNNGYQNLLKELDTNKDIAEQEVRRIIGILTTRSVF